MLVLKDDIFDAPMLHKHLLVVAAALRRSSVFDQSAHPDMYPQNSSLI